MHNPSRRAKRTNLALALLTFVAVAAATPATAQVTTRFVVPGGSATSTKITPGQSASFDVRLDSSVQTIGAAFTITQSAPPGSGYLSITGRDFTGGIYTDTSSGTSDSIVLNPPSNLLDPTNNDNLGRSSPGLAAVAAGTNLLIEKLTLTSTAGTPLGTYVITPTGGGVSNVTGADVDFTDYPMAGSFSIIIGQTLTVTKSGTGTGTVTASSGAIDCGATCSDIYPGNAVILTATPDAGSVFTGWTGACTGTGTCTVTVDAAKTVNAQFDTGPQTLTVNKAGSGTGTVTSSPAGISCGATCSTTFTAGTSVTLTATPDAGSTFTGWSGACTGTGSCVVTMSTARTVTATFAVQTFSLTLTKSGNGVGTVTSSPAAISCATSCISQTATGLTSGSVYTLTATAGTGQTFTGWSGGGCSGTGTCAVTMTANVTVTATFTDTIPPDTTITGTPTNPSSDPTPTFTFTSDDPAATFQCSLDGGTFTSCASPYTVIVGNGTHTFSVRAIDQAGNIDPTPATFTWVVSGVVQVATPVPALDPAMLAAMMVLVAAIGVAMRRKG